MLMLLQSWTFPSAPSQALAPKHNPLPLRKPKASTFVCLRLGIDEIAEIVHNKVVIAAAVSAAIGQLSKPFTSAILYGNKFEFKAVIQAGGFPSSHSSAVVATATSLGLERGFSDSIFGMTVVYAGLVMYDAQGVRREVGNHAKVLNRILLETQVNSIPSKDRDDIVDSIPGTSSLTLGGHGPPLSEEASSYLTPKSTNARLLLRSDNRMKQTSPMQVSSSLAVDVEGGSEKAGNSLTPLKDSIGHTEVEVIAGALLGFFVSLAVYSIM